MLFRTVLLIAGLLALLFTVACESYYATQTAEAPTKEVEEATKEAEKAVENQTKEAEEAVKDATKEAKAVAEDATKEAEKAKDVGIGVALETFESDFGGDLGFENAPLADGRSRKIGRSPDGIATLELIGPESNLTQVTLVLGLDSSKSDFLALYTMRAFATVTPDWMEEGLDFFGDSMESLQMMEPEANDSFVTQHGDVQIALSAVANLPIVLLNFVSTDTDLTPIIPTPPPTSAIWNPGRWETDEYEAKKILNKSHVLWVGAIGNGGLKPGRYEYRDANGGEIVNESGCHLTVNRGEPNNQQRVQLAEGESFSVKLGPIHGYASFGGFKGSRCRGSLYRMGS